MSKFEVDKRIETICNKIDDNIKAHTNSNIELLSQNIIGELRHLAEHVALKIDSNGSDIDVGYEDIQQAIINLKKKGQLKWLRRFHDWTQASVSHYSPDGENAYRLMLKYYEVLIRIKAYLLDNHGLEVLNNIDQFPIKQDSDLQQYHEKIVEKIESSSQDGRLFSYYKDRYYIQGTKPFFVNGRIYYQISFMTAYNNVSKFDRIIAFSKLDIPDNYAIKFTIKTYELEVFEGIKMPLKVIENYNISIRPCEIDNFAKIFSQDTKNKNNSERDRLMEYLTDNRLNLVDFMEMDNEQYKKARTGIVKKNKPVVFSVLDKCKALIQNKEPGENLIKYLLFSMRNKIINHQYEKNTCNKLSNLKFKWGCIPFDEMPFCTSLVGHNPKNLDLFECLDNTNREHEHLARVIKNNTEIRGILYTKETELSSFNDLDKLINDHNDKLYYKHRPKRDLCKHYGHIYLYSYEDDAKQIIESLKKLTGCGIEHYEKLTSNYLNENPDRIDCDQKKKVLKQAFTKSRIICLYGSAGTGKTRFIEHLSDLFKEKEQIFLANTNSAVNNLKRRISLKKYQFQTIKKYNNSAKKKTYILVIDECSTVSNADMRKLLKNPEFKILVLVGDIYQIESISFGNWFNISKKALPEYCIFEFNKPYRTKDKNLLGLWKKVRNGDDKIAEHITHHGYASNLNQELYQTESQDDEIILCLNYGGLYGVNNINAFFQENNPNPAFYWETKVYKVGDPVLFSENQKFSNIIYNNCKGKIKNIEIKNKQIIFDVALEIKIEKTDIMMPTGIKLLSNSNQNNSTVRFSISEHKNTDEDDDSLDTHVPFHIAYAVSIHKAQGLEYDWVKVVISDDTEEQVSHNIFYTAITRARKHLKIYWSAETQNNILERIKHTDDNKDWYLLSKKMEEKQV